MQVAGRTNSILELQLDVQNKLSKVTIEVIKEIHITLLNSIRSSPQDLVNNFIIPKRNQLSQLDERTSKFFQKMVESINEQLNTTFPGLIASFNRFGQVVKDPQIQIKFVEAVALPQIQNLVAELDAIKSSIIDDIIAV